jgi:hypothetical protein
MSDFAAHSSARLPYSKVDSNASVLAVSTIRQLDHYEYLISGPKGCVAGFPTLHCFEDFASILRYKIVLSAS